VESALADGLDDVGAKHQVLDVASGDDDALSAGEFDRAANVVETLHLHVDSADRLDFTLLVHGPRDGEVLANRHVRQRREDRACLAERGAIAIHRIVALLE
jgi:hypothetical protein